MIRVLWLCNVPVTNSSLKSTGTWLTEMARALLSTGNIKLFVISEGNVKNIVKQDQGEIVQWIVPYQKLSKYGLPSRAIIEAIQHISDSVTPDIIHVWGTENYWGLLTVRGYLKGNVLLEIQGLKFIIEKYFYSGLTLRDVLQCFGPKELIKPSGSITGLKRAYRKWGLFEKEMLLKHLNISTQSDWVRANIRTVNPEATIYHSSIILRAEFIHADIWDLEFCNNFQIFTSISSLVPYKGLHVLIEAIALLKYRYPSIRLCIAGYVPKSKLRRNGYFHWLIKKIRQLNLTNNVHWIGPLDAKNLVDQLQKANVFVNPSFIESYSLTLREALAVGTPTVCSFSGAMPELAVHEQTALFFSPGDITMCADAIERILADTELAQSLSSNSYQMERSRLNVNVPAAQLGIYWKIMEKIKDDKKTKT